jgi:hypothetical protein
MSEPWIQGIWDSFDAIDALMYSQAAANGTTVWLNATQYGPGMTVIDVTDGSTWICTTAHTSAAAPTSFAQDRTTNPSFWTAIMLSIQARGQWLNSTPYNSGDMVYDTTAGRNIQAVCVTKHVSNATGTINDDAAYWGFTYNSLSPQTAAGIGYSNAVSHLVAINVQTAIDEVSAGSSAPPVMDGIAAAGASVKLSRGDHVHPTDTSRAPLNSPVFTGTPTAPTPPALDSTAKLATTAFVQAAVIGGITGGNIPPAGTLMPLVDATPGAVGVSVYYTREDHVHPTDTSRAPLASPAFTGTPTAPTPIAGDNSTKVATTAFSAANEVRTDIVQALTAAQQTQARQNIYAAPFDALAYNGMQINGGVEVGQENGNTPIFGGPGGTGINKYVADGWVVAGAGAQGISYGSNGANAYPLAPGYPSYAGVWSNVANTAPAAGDYLIMRNVIEGYRTARLAWGTANAQPISIGFWFYSSRTGAYPLSIRNNGGTRSYITTFQVNAANTWEWKAVTIPGDVTGTWDTTNGLGIGVTFSIMCGSTYQTATTGAWTNGLFLGPIGALNAISTTPSSWIVTGLIVLPGLELPSAARAPFIMRPFDQEMVLCQRYLEYVGEGICGFSNSASSVSLGFVYKVQKRTNPTVSLSTTTPGMYFGSGGYVSATAATIAAQGAYSVLGGLFSINGFASLTNAYPCVSNTSNLFKSDARF